jgi:hypothetical protein
MANIDLTSRELWNLKEPTPLGLLAAVGCGRSACATLTEEERAPFDAFGAALLAWWPKKTRAPAELHEVEFAACVKAREGSDRLRLAMDAAYIEMAAALRLDKRSLSADGVYQLGEDDFVALVRNVAKASHTDLELFKARFELLLEHKKTPWPELVALTDRIGFGRDMAKLKRLPEQLQALGRLADLGGKATWSMMGPKHALKVELGSTKRTAVIDDEQREQVLELLPWLA